jgi:hypothetical protein
VKRWRGVLAGATALVFGCATWLACTVTYGTEPGPSPVADATADTNRSPDAQLDAGTLEAEAGPALFTIPERPSSEDDTGQDLTLVFALQWFGATAESAFTTLTAETAGYDLDGLQTCPQSGSCKASAGSAATSACDGLGGRDNGFLRLLENFGLAANFKGFNASGGDFSLLFVVQGYNGGANDRQVTVRVYSSTGTQAALPDGGADPDSGIVSPKFDGNDFWRIDQSQLQNTPPLGTQCSQPSDPCASAYKHTAAYVANGLLVSELDLPIPFPAFGPKARLDLRSGYVIAKLEKVNETWTLNDGQITGRCTVESLLKIFGLFSDPFASGKSYCQVPVDFLNIKKVICEGRDIHTDRAKDGKDEACNGMSLSFMFKALPTRLGTVSTQPTTFVDPCPPDTDYGCSAAQ